jgi:hypothetical protein
VSIAFDINGTVDAFQVMSSQFIDILITAPTIEESYSVNTANQEDIMLFTNCTVGNSTIVSYVCPLTKTVISHTCYGNSTYSVRTQCPTLQRNRGCDVISSNDGIVSATCNIVDYSEYSTTCKCSILINPETSTRKLVDIENFIFQNTYALEVVAISEDVAMDFADTIVSTKDFDSVSDLKKVIIVMMLYGTLWGIGIIGLSYWSLHSRRSAKKIGMDAFEKHKNKRIAESTKSISVVQDYLYKYLDETFPHVFHNEYWLTKLWNEIINHHRYIILFRPSKDRLSDKMHIVTAIHLLTVQSMLMFMLAVLYDVQVCTI